MTAAGEELAQAISGPFEAIGQSVEALNHLRDEPGERVRLNVLGETVPLLLGPVLPIIAEHHPNRSRHLREQSHDRRHRSPDR